MKTYIVGAFCEYAEMAAQNDADCLAALAQAESDDKRLESLSDDEFSDSYRTHLEKRRDWNRYLADEARNRAEVFRGED